VSNLLGKKERQRAYLPERTTEGGGDRKGLFGTEERISRFSLSQSGRAWERCRPQRESDHRKVCYRKKEGGNSSTFPEKATGLSPGSAKRPGRSANLIGKKGGAPPSSEKTFPREERRIEMEL